jgi:hypothetical protein
MRFLAIAASALLLALAGCSKKSSGDDGPPPLTVSIDTPVADQSILVGGSISFSGSVASGTAPHTYLWTFPGGTPASSTNPVAGSVSFNTAGVYVVTLQVTDSTGLTGWDSVTVNVYKVLQSISLTPLNPSLNQGSTLDFTVTATFSDTTTLNVTAAATYTSGDTTRVRMTVNRALALVGPSLTPVMITADYTHGVTGNTKSGTSTITLLDPVVRYTKAQIQTRWYQLDPAETTVSYTSNPDMTSPTGVDADVGQLKEPSMITDGINKANLYRYLAGLPDDLTETPSKRLNCQKGAHVLATLDLQGLTGYNPHSPPIPSGVTIGDLYYTNIYTPGVAACGESNIFRGWFTGTDTGNVPMLPECVDGWVDDFGNPTTLGHRRWILYPELKTTTFGMIWASHGASVHTHYTCLMYVGDLTRATPAYDFVAYPSEGFYPKQCMDDPNDGERVLWSFSANAAKYNLDTNTVVTVVRQSDGQTISTTTSMLLNNYGITPSISFNPNESNLNETYYVTVSNILRLSDSTIISYSYWVNFFNIP